MKEEPSGNIAQRQTMEQVHPISDIGTGSQRNLQSEGEYLRKEEQDARRSPRSTLRADFVPASDGNIVAFNGVGQPTNSTASPEDAAQQLKMEKWALENAPPPIKVRREGDTPEDSSPPELSPPPSPKRMRELSRKDLVKDLAFSKVLSQSSV